MRTNILSVFMQPRHDRPPTQELTGETVSSGVLKSHTQFRMESPICDLALPSLDPPGLAGSGDRSSPSCGYFSCSCCERYRAFREPGGSRYLECSAHPGNHLRRSATDGTPPMRHAQAAGWFYSCFESSGFSSARSCRESRSLPSTTVARLSCVLQCA